MSKRYCPDCMARVEHRGGLCTVCHPAPEPVPVAEPLALWPTTPPSNGTDTSDAAAASLSEAQINAGHGAVLNALWRHRDEGLTNKALCAATRNKERAA